MINKHTDRSRAKLSKAMKAFHLKTGLGTKMGNIRARGAREKRAKRVVYEEPMPWMEEGHK